MKLSYETKVLILTTIVVAWIAVWARAVNYTLVTASTVTATAQSAYTAVKTGYYNFDVRVTSASGSNPILNIGISELGMISSDPVVISSYQSVSNQTNITTTGLYSFQSDILVGGSIRANYSIQTGSFTFTVTAREINP